MDNGKRVVSRGLRLTVLFNVWLTKQRRKIYPVAQCTPAVNHHSLDSGMLVALLRPRDGVSGWVMENGDSVELGTCPVVRSPGSQQVHQEIPSGVCG